MIEILNSAVGTVVLVGLVVLYWLFRRNPDGAWQPLQRYFWFSLMSWAVLMLMETVIFLSLEIDGLDGVRTMTYRDVQRLIFRALTAWAICGLVRHIFTPKLIPTTPIAVAQVVMDWRGIVREWNEEATNLLGWTAEEAIGQELASLIIPEDLEFDYQGQKMLARDAHRQALERFRTSGDAPILNTRFPTIALVKKGDTIMRRPVEVRVTAHSTAGGTTFLGTLTPVSPLGL